MSELKESDVQVFTLKNKLGMEAKFINYGAILVSLRVPDRNGDIGEVTLGHEKWTDYFAGLNGTSYFGATVGRVCNRICKGKFTVNGQEYQLACNNGVNALHGGPKGFSRVMWQAMPYTVSEANNNRQGIKFTYTAADGEEGYPGRVHVTADYSMPEDANQLHMHFTATTDKATPVNITNHTFWNLGGPASGTILNHEFKFNADHYLPIDETSIPTGVLQPVKGTPFDFLDFHTAAERFDQVQEVTRGYDHNMVLNKPNNKKELTLAVTVREPVSGRVMTVETTEFGCQFYSGNYMQKAVIAGGVEVDRNHAFCVETQGFPDAVNHSTFPSVILNPGEIYNHVTIHTFGTY